MKFRLFLILLGISFGSANLRSQNLVPNHDFDQMGLCNLGTISNYVKDSIFDNWFTPPYSTQDLSQFGLLNQPRSFSPYHQCFWPDSVFQYGRDSVFDPFSFPPCLLYINDYPFPKEGSGYIGLKLTDTLDDLPRYGYVDVGCNGNYVKHNSNLWPAYFGRNFVEVGLSNSLEPNEDYTIEFYTRHATNPKWLYSKNIAAFVSQDTFSYFDYLKNSLLPTIESSKTIYENKKWIKISGSFLSNGMERFLTIGNFRKDHQSDYRFIIPADTNRPSTGGDDYYIDAVYLYKSTDTLFNVLLPPDTTLCPGEPITLYAEHDDGFKLKDTTKTFLWNTGSTDSSITASAPGIYWVKVEYNQRWWQTDTITIEEIEPYTSGLPTEVEGCQDDPIRLEANEPLPHHFLEWNTGETDYQIEAADSGYYWLTTTWRCDTVVDSVLVKLENCEPPEPPKVWIPTAFSPNGDGRNDFWTIANLPEDNELIILDRWGKIHYRKENYRGDWDGTNGGGEKLPPGSYVYTLIYTYPPGITERKYGSVTIVDW